MKITFSKMMEQNVILYAIDNDHLWDLYETQYGYLVAIPCDPTSGRQECVWGSKDYLDRFERRFDRKHSYTIV
jgi:hypothetical protein